ncbi:MAG: hypothetical protein JNJ60_04820 [Rhodocyclaceae bacterium]|nr:hypothetical protein [Rhodocyclaceae bacterium]
MPLRAALQNMLAGPTTAQQIVARAWLRSGIPLAAHMYAYRNFVDISEVRWLLTARGARFVSACLRGNSAAVLARAMPAMRGFAEQLACHLPKRAHLVELACLPDGAINLVEINPALRPDELRALHTA